jgi:hypothetical protein
VVKKPGLTQEEWACQGEYRVWSKRCASFNLPLWAENLYKWQQVAGSYGKVARLKYFKIEKSWNRVELGTGLLDLLGYKTRCNANLIHERERNFLCLCKNF